MTKRLNRKVGKRAGRKRPDGGFPLRPRPRIVLVERGCSHPVVASVAERVWQPVFVGPGSAARTLFVAGEQELR